MKIAIQVTAMQGPLKDVRKSQLEVEEPQ